MGTDFTVSVVEKTSDVVEPTVDSLVELIIVPEYVVLSTVEETDEPGVVVPPVVEETDEPGVVVPPVVEKTDEPVAGMLPVVEETDEPGVVVPPVAEETDEPVAGVLLIDVEGNVDVYPGLFDVPLVEGDPFVLVSLVQDKVVHSQGGHVVEAVVTETFDEDVDG